MLCARARHRVDPHPRSSPPPCWSGSPTRQDPGADRPRRRRPGDRPHPGPAGRRTRAGRDLPRLPAAARLRGRLAHLAAGAAGGDAAAGPALDRPRLRHRRRRRRRRPRHRARPELGRGGDPRRHPRPHRRGRRDLDLPPPRRPRAGAAAGRRRVDDQRRHRPRPLPDRRRGRDRRRLQPRRRGARVRRRLRRRHRRRARRRLRLRPRPPPPERLRPLDLPLGADRLRRLHRRRGAARLRHPRRRRRRRLRRLPLAALARRRHPPQRASPSGACSSSGSRSPSSSCSACSCRTSSTPSKRARPGSSDLLWPVAAIAAASIAARLAFVFAMGCDAGETAGRALRGRLERDARRRLAGRGPGGAAQRQRPAADHLPHLRPDPRHPRRPGPLAALHRPRPAARGAAPLVRRRGGGADGGGAVGARPDRRDGGRGARQRDTS